MGGIFAQEVRRNPSRRENGALPRVKRSERSWTGSSPAHLITLAQARCPRPPQGEMMKLSHPTHGFRFAPPVAMRLRSSGTECSHAGLFADIIRIAFFRLNGRCNRAMIEKYHDCARWKTNPWIMLSGRFGSLTALLCFGLTDCGPSGANGMLTQPQIPGRVSIAPGTRPIMSEDLR